jgi:hypothetical protein
MGGVLIFLYSAFLTLTTLLCMAHETQYCNLLYNLGIMNTKINLYEITFEGFGLSDIPLGTGVHDIPNSESFYRFVLLFLF